MKTAPIPAAARRAVFKLDNDHCRYAATRDDLAEIIARETHLAETCNILRLARNRLAALAPALPWPQDPICDRIDDLLSKLETP